MITTILDGLSAGSRVINLPECQIKWILVKNNSNRTIRFASDASGWQTVFGEVAAYMTDSIPIPINLQACHIDWNAVALANERSFIYFLPENPQLIGNFLTQYSEAIREDWSHLANAPDNNLPLNIIINAIPNRYHVITSFGFNYRVMATPTTNNANIIKTTLMALHPIDASLARDFWLSNIPPNSPDGSGVYVTGIKLVCPINTMVDFHIDQGGINTLITGMIAGYTI